MFLAFKDNENRYHQARPLSNRNWSEKSSSNRNGRVWFLSAQKSFVENYKEACRFEALSQFYDEKHTNSAIDLSLVAPTDKHSFMYIKIACHLQNCCTVVDFYGG
jgi:hypothetical protein